MARLTSEMLRSVPRERDVVSFADGVDRRGRALLLKFVLSDGTNDVLILPPAIAFHVQRSVSQAMRQGRYRDVRRRRGDGKPEVQIIRRFLDSQPDFKDDDWVAPSSGPPRTVIGCEVHGFRDALFLAFQLTADIFKVLRLPTAICFYLPEMVAAAERSGCLIDLERTASPSDQKQ